MTHSRLGAVTSNLFASGFARVDQLFWIELDDGECLFQLHLIAHESMDVDKLQGRESYSSLGPTPTRW